jgi:hypothetical protein
LLFDDAQDSIPGNFVDNLAIIRRGAEQLRVLARDGSRLSERRNEAKQNDQWK